MTMPTDQGHYVPPAGGPTSQQAPIVVQMPPQSPPAAPQAGMTREEIEQMLNAERERVRQEEKDKLYPQLESLGTQLKELTDDRDAKLAAEEQARQEAEEAERLRQQSEQTAIERLAAAEERWSQELAAQREEAAKERALREQEFRFGQLADYRARKLAEFGDQVHPQLLDYITGNSPDEIDASVAGAIEKTNALTAEVQDMMTGQRRQTVLPMSGAPAVSPEQLTGEEGTRTLSAADIASMDPGEYAAYRQQLMTAASDSVRRNGLYGTA